MISPSRLAATLLGAMALASPAFAARDPICTALERFGRSALVQDGHGARQPRSVELFWFGPWGVTNMGYECRHHGDAASLTLCRTLEPPPQEFRTSLVFRILRCSGYQFPSGVVYRWDQWDAQIELARFSGPHLNDPSAHLRLDVHMYPANGHRDAIRLIVLPDEFDPDGALPPIDEPIPPDDDQPR